ncbi:MAG: hypothetical protein ACREPU_04295 [Rhodanobacteraceae bacterium]
MTPAEVTGEPREHLVLRGHHPNDIRPYEQSQPDHGYLITGNKVDVVTSCEGFDYVRFHGPKRVSTGWVDAARVKATGPAHGTLPRDAATLCRSAEKTLNAGQLLSVPSESQLDDKVIDRILPSQWQRGSNGSPTQVAHVVVDGKLLAAIVVDSGGTSHDTSVYVLSGNLKILLSPPDRDDRDIQNYGADDWGFGVSEDVVTVLGQPMVRSTGRPYGKWPVYLSIIDRDGDIVPTCEIKKEPLKERVITWNTDSRVCHAMLAGQQIPVPMHPPVPGESLELEKVPTRFSTYGGRIRSTATELNYHDTERAASVRYTLLATGIVDLDNSGQTRRVGIVAFWTGDSSAGDGTYTDSEIFPAYLDKNGVADLSTDANRQLAGALPHGMGNGKLVILDGTTYLELSPDRKRPSNDVWKFNSKGADEICRFKLTHEVVRPIAE